MMPITRFRKSGVALLSVTMLSVGGCATQPPAPTPAPAAAKTADAPPAAHTVTRGSLKAKAQADAVFQARDMAALKLEPKAWADLTVLDVVPHGARVKKGEVLLKLDTEKLKDQIADTEQDQPAANLALELAVAEMENLTQTTPQKLEAARRGARVASEDLAYFEKVGRDQREKNARFSLKSAEQRLEYAREELKQLEKMYKNDDLVEETEEIILKRQRNTVEAAEFSLASIKLGTERDLSVLIPREAETTKSNRRDQEFALTLAEESLPKALAKKRLDVEKMKRDQKKAEKRLADLKTDLQHFTLRAPIDGLVYYGACEGGKWPTAPVLAKKLVPGSKLMPIEVLMTVANPDRMVLKAIIAETDFAKFKTGMTGQAAPVAAPERKLPVKLEEIGLVPTPTGGFEATFAVTADKVAGLVPGMNARITLGETGKSEALMVPSDAVFVDGGQKVVYVLKPDGTSGKRTVKIGDSENKQTEILEGLAEGDKILLKQPK